MVAMLVVVVAVVVVDGGGDCGEGGGDGGDGVYGFAFQKNMFVLDDPFNGLVVIGRGWECRVKSHFKSFEVVLFNLTIKLTIKVPHLTPFSGSGRCWKISNLKLFCVQ